MRVLKTAFCLLLCVLLLCQPIYSFADVHDDAGWYYTVDGNGDAIITGLIDGSFDTGLFKILKGVKSGNKKEVPVTIRIPETVDKHPVVAIGDRAFSGINSFNDKFKITFAIPDCVTTIGENPFNERFNVSVNTTNPGLAMIDGVLYSKSDKRLVFCPKMQHVDELVIPSGIEIIGSNAFPSFSGADAIVLPDTVKEIRANAFSSCKVQTINIPESVTTLGKEAFSGSSIASAVIPSTITVIPEGCFSRSGIKSITLPDNLESISKNAFLFSSLEEITLPEGLRSIGESAFYRAHLTEISIPASVTEIGATPFSGALTAIDISPDNTSFKLENNLLIDLKEMRVLYFLAAPDVTEVAVPDGVLAIGKGVFEDQKKLETVVLPDSLEEIGDDAFHSCEALKEIVLPENLKSIGGCAFEDCKGLESVSIPASVRTIGYRAFCDCEGLKSLTFTDAEISIEYGLLSGCNMEELKITVPSGSPAEAYLIEEGYYQDTGWLNN